MTLETWERRTDWPLTVLAVVFLGCYAWPILDPGLDGSLVSGLSVLSLVIWSAFGVDYIASVYLSDDRVTYVRRLLRCDPPVGINVLGGVVGDLPSHAATGQNLIDLVVPRRIL